MLLLGYWLQQPIALNGPRDDAVPLERVRSIPQDFNLSAQSVLISDTEVC